MGSHREQITYSARAVRYCHAVLTGEILACKWVKAAARRHLDDLADTGSAYRYDEAEAERVCRFAERMPHIRGEWARKKQTIKLEDWQCFILCAIFGWIRKADGKRKYRTVYLEVARKNAKSTLLAIIALYLLAVDGEAGSEVYSAATTRDQARIVFDTARRMAEKEPEFRRRFRVQCFKDSVAVPDSSGMLKPLSAEANTLDGLNPHGAIIDELHAHRTREVWDVMETATGARSQPLIVAITTAGSNRAGICYEIRSYACKVLNATLHRHDGLWYTVGGDTVVDETFFGAVYTLDDEDDWTNPANWIKPNPNLGVSVYPDDLERQAKKAMATASAQPNFLTKRMDVWVNQEVAWMDMRAWDAAGAKLIPYEYLDWEWCFGLDLASKKDIASLAMIARRGREKKLFTRHWLPEDAVEESDNSQYKGWAASGFIKTTEGNVMDHETVIADIEKLCEQLKPRVIAYDPGYDQTLPQILANRGIPVISVRASPTNFSEPMKQLEADVLSGHIEHDGNPVMTWMISNVSIDLRRREMLYPSKGPVDQKIDGAVAATLAMSQLISADMSTLTYIT